MVVDLTPLCEAVIALVSAIVTAWLIPLLREKVGEEKLRTAKIWTQAAVAAAEKLFEGDGRGDEKLGFVTDFLESRGLGLDTESLRQLIEAEVYSLGLK